ncbi:MAG: hypothetical protein IT168_15300 [Bryobacterales bacterium]|nr:hypothetical protein [Bryobacterales bacterium]
MISRQDPKTQRTPARNADGVGPNKMSISEARADLVEGGEVLEDVVGFCNAP